jgi:hypothetical protein
MGERARITGAAVEGGAGGESVGPHVVETHAATGFKTKQGCRSYSAQSGLYRFLSRSPR